MDLKWDVQRFVLAMYFLLFCKYSLWCVFTLCLFARWLLIVKLISWSDLRQNRDKWNTRTATLEIWPLIKLLRSQTKLGWNDALTRPGRSKVDGTSKSGFRRQQNVSFFSTHTHTQFMCVTSWLNGRVPKAPDLLHFLLMCLRSLFLIEAF